MKPTIPLIVGGTLLTISVVQLHAQKPGSKGRGDPWSRIQQYDKDEDGRVTKEEFDGPAMIMDRFDTNEDGVITKEEVEAMRGKMGGGGQRPQGGGGKGKTDSAPKVGDPAPDVSALRRGTDERVDLSAPKRHTVIVFGSHT